MDTDRQPRGSAPGIPVRRHADFRTKAKPVATIQAHLWPGRMRQQERARMRPDESASTVCLQRSRTRRRERQERRRLFLPQRCAGHASKNAACQAVPSTGVVVARVAGHAPESDLAFEKRIELGDVPDTHHHAVITARAYGRVENHGHFKRLETKPCRLTRFRHEVEQRDWSCDKAKAGGFDERQHRHADRRVGRTYIYKVEHRCKLAIGALRDDVHVADQTRRQIELEILRLSGLRCAVGFPAVRLKSLVEREPARYLERVRTRLGIGRAILVCRGELRTFRPQRRSEHWTP